MNEQTPDQNEWLLTCERLIKERGPLRARTLAKELGLQNARSLSMKLQHSRKFEMYGQKWRLAPIK